MKRLKDNSKKIAIGFVGWFVLIAGIVMIPYPGPGWVVVFIGLSILGTEFDWAKRVHTYAHDKYSAWQVWIASQKPIIRVIFWLLTCLTVIVTVWLFNGYGIVNSWLNLGQNWLQSPIF